MIFAQHKFREIVFQILFSQDFMDDEGEIVDCLMEQLSVSKKHVKAALAKAQAIRERLPQIDEKIRRFSHSYEENRIGRAEKNILRLAIYELFYEESIPPKVVMAEAIRLSRKFSTLESALFVNAVLDAVFQNGKGDG